MTATEMELHEKLLDAHNAAVRRYNLLRRAIESLIRTLSDAESDELRDMIREELKTPIFGGPRQKYTIENVQGFVRADADEPEQSESIA